MAGGFSAAPADGAAAFAERMRRLEDRLGELERPTGTSQASLVRQVQETLANINAAVQTAIAENSYTKTVIDERIAAAVAAPGDISPTNVTVSGAMSVGGSGSVGTTMTVGTDLTVSGGATVAGAATVSGVITSPGTRANPISTFRTVVQDEAGAMGYSSSAASTKQDIELCDFPEGVFQQIGWSCFRFIRDVELLGDDAPVHYGFIADEFVDAGYEEFAFFDENGEVQGLNYDRLVGPLWSVLQQALRRIETLEGKP
jgi:hypothetical protein